MPYADLNDVKRLCGIAIVDTTYDELFNETILPKVDKKVDNDLSEFASDVPLSGSELLTETQQELATQWSVHLYGQEAHDDFLYRSGQEEYARELKSFAQYLKSKIVSNKNKFVVVASDYQSEPMHSSRD